MVKIIHLITRLDYGGSAENTFLSAREFVKKGYDVSIWAGTGYDLPRHIAEEAKAANIKLFFIPALVRSLHPIQDIFSLIAIVKKLRLERPAILHTHTSKAGFIGRLAGRIAKIPVIVHTPHGHIFYGYFSPFKTKLFIFFERIAAKWADAIIPLTKKGMEEHLARRIGKKEQYVPIASGVETSKILFSPELRKKVRQEYGLNEEITVVGSLGRFVLIKGFDLIVKGAPLVLTECPQVKFYLAGTGPLKEKLIERVKIFGMEEKFIFDEFQEVANPFHLIDIFVLSSRNEGQSRTLIEAMLYERGIVASKVGGVVDVIEHEKTGLLVSGNSATALAKGIIKLIKDPEKAKNCGQKARVIALEKYSLTLMIEELEKLYQSILKRKNGSL